MSLRIKPIKQTAGSSKLTKASKRRIDSDEEDATLAQDLDNEGPSSQPQHKRAKTEDSDHRATGSDGEPDVDVEVDIEADAEDTRFLPPEAATLSAPSPPPAKASKRKSGKPKVDGKSTSERRSKRTVVWTDDEDDEFVDAGRIMDSEDEDFAPESAPPSKKGAVTKGKGLKPSGGTKGARGRGKKEEKEIIVRDERKLPPAAPSAPKDRSAVPAANSKRPAPKDDRQVAVAEPAAAEKAQEPVPLEEAAPPLPKKRKLPTIKKNKASATPSTPSVAAVSPAVGEKKDAAADVITPVGVAARKPAATANNADFDLRDKSVYAQLFTKASPPGGTTPNSGLNRKEKEEERRKELNKMRDDARAKRADEAKRSFDLQSAHDKIARFEEKLRARKSIAAFPNILGAYFKSVHEAANKEEPERREQ
ncbi:uncharacterized protein FIBRA_05229 [Fibroporia radiculosa]|uniref:Uncharacterized protein n=1 Tax=Fibroporia radiculosa TaxID=599839 RepID=J4H3E0_9APHY|nr:uncharacterized protein FIBRA_05229 [Fibroporia radiculosa]CCM03109.1 predicted protein [Fibroporia radiculosa]